LASVYKSQGLEVVFYGPTGVLTNVASPAQVTVVCESQGLQTVPACQPQGITAMSLALPLAPLCKIQRPPTSVRRMSSNVCIPAAQLPHRPVAQPDFQQVLSASSQQGLARAIPPTAQPLVQCKILGSGSSGDPTLTASELSLSHAHSYAKGW